MNSPFMQRLRIVALVATAGICVGVLPAAAGTHKALLPAAARSAINAAFPGAKIGDVESTTEKGTVHYSVDVTWQKRKLEIEVAADGTLGEIQENVKFDSLPAAVAQKVTGKANHGKVLKIEKTEIRGVPNKGTFTPLAEAQILYEITVRPVHGKKLELRLDQAGNLVADDEDDEGGHEGEDGDNDDNDNEQEGEHEDND